MANGPKGTVRVGIVLSILCPGGRRWSRLRLISQDGEGYKQNLLLFVSNSETGMARLQLIHTAQRMRTPRELSEDGSALSVQCRASLRHQQRAHRRESGIPPAICSTPLLSAGSHPINMPMGTGFWRFTAAWKPAVTLATSTSSCCCRSTAIADPLTPTGLLTASSAIPRSWKSYRAKCTLRTPMRVIK